MKNCTATQSVSPVRPLHRNVQQIQNVVKVIFDKKVQGEQVLNAEEVQADDDGDAEDADATSRADAAAAALPEIPDGLFGDEAPVADEPAAHGGDDDPDLDFRCEECAPLRRLPDPGQPSQSEFEDHRITHWPYRSWCPYCVSGRATGERHCKHACGNRSVPVFSFDYLLVTKNKILIAGEPIEEEIILKIIVAKDSSSKAIFAHVVNKKGVDEQGYVVQRLAEDIRWLGHKRIGLRSDNENAILKVLRTTMEAARFEVVDLDQVFDEYPVPYDSSSNGHAESAVKQVQGMLRSHKACLEERLGRKVPVDHPVMTWLVEFTAWMITVCRRGPDGRTAFQLTRGREYLKRLLGFAEKVQYKLPTKGPRHDPDGKLGNRWPYGIMLGYSRTSYEYWIWDGQRVVKVRDVQRLPMNRRWDMEAVAKVNVECRHTYAARPVRAVPFADPAGDAPSVSTRAAVPRQLQLRKRDFEAYGYTEGCAKCDHARRYGYGQTAGNGLAHSAQCRERISVELNKTAAGRERVQAAELRRVRYLAEQVEAGAARAEGEKAVDRAIIERAEGDPQPARPDLPLPGQLDRGVVAADGPEAPCDLRDPPDLPNDAPHNFDLDAEWSPLPPGIGDQIPMTPQIPPCSATSQTMSTGDKDGPLPADASPTSPEMDSQDDVRMEDGMDLGIMEDEDEAVKKFKRACASLPQTLERISEVDREIMTLINNLGGNPRQYRRERKRTVKAIVAELYSGPRVTKALKMLPELKMIPGFALDLTTCDADGRNWDFDDPEMRRRALKKIELEKPMFIIGSPMCTAYSTWQRLLRARRDPHQVRRQRVRADLHMAFTMEVYKMQMDGGRYFLHEHPAYAESWQLSSVKDVARCPNVDTVVGDQCQYQQEADTGAPVKKPTRWMSNSSEVLKQLSKRCSGRGGLCSRSQGGAHHPCSGRAAMMAAVYPFELCRAILVGCRNQLQKDGIFVAELVGMHAPEEILNILELETSVEEIFNVRVHGKTQYRDEITGQPLIPELVHQARKKELDYFNSKNVWMKRFKAEAHSRTGKPPVTVRWIDTNKGDDLHPNYRSRLVARDIRRPGEEALFAPTPPLESLRTILSFAATNLPGRPKHVRDPESEMRTQISFVDVVRAYFCASTNPDDPTYVALPPEDPDHGTKCGLLLKHMYGTKEAANGWHREYTGTLRKLGFRPGAASACVFWHPGKRLSCSVHGDDLTTEGPKQGLDWFEHALEEHYEITKTGRLGPGPKDDKEVRVLNRMVRWTLDGLEYEADPRQGEKLLRDVKLDGSRSVGTPGVKPSVDELMNDQALPEDKHGPFRAVAARGNFLAADRPELQFSCKEICRWMSSPTEHSLKALKRLGRFLEGHRRLVYEYPWQDASSIETYSDTDWAGCAKTRKSTSGGCMLLGRHLIKSWSSTQSQTALSSGEAEYYGVVRAAGISMGYKSLLKDLGVQLPSRLWTDSSATMGICNRQGLGKLRHINTQTLWIQQRVRDGAFELRKVRGDDNPADLFTKFLSSPDRIAKLLGLFGCRYRSGRAETAPVLREGYGTTKGELLATEASERGDELIRWDGKVYPLIRVDGEDLPDAYEFVLCSQLPHECADLEERFPKAIVREYLEDDKVEDDDILEGIDDANRLSEQQFAVHLKCIESCAHLNAPFEVHT